MCPESGTSKKSMSFRAWGTLSSKIGGGGSQGQAIFQRYWDVCLLASRWELSTAIARSEGQPHGTKFRLSPVQLMQSFGFFHPWEEPRPQPDDHQKGENDTMSLMVRKDLKGGMAGCEHTLPCTRIQTK